MKNMIEKDTAVVGATKIKWFGTESSEVDKAARLLEEYKIAKEKIETEFQDSVKYLKEIADMKMEKLQMKTKKEISLL